MCPPLVTFTRVPIADRLDRVPTHLIMIQLFLFPPSLRSSDGGLSRLFTITSTSPSLSKSPKAQPRPRFSARIGGPTLAETSSKRPFPRLRYKTLGSSYDRWSLRLAI